MTIDEEIQRIKEKMACDYNISGCDTCNISSCEDKDIVIQLAEWLEELKSYRASVFSGDMTQIMLKEEYRKAIDDFAEEILQRLTYAIYQNDVQSITNLINDVAEKLKGE